MMMSESQIETFLENWWQENVYELNKEVARLKRNTIYSIAGTIADNRQEWKWKFSMTNDGFRLKGENINDELYLHFSPSLQDDLKLELRNTQGALLALWTDTCGIWKMMSWYDRMGAEGLDFIEQFIEVAIPKPQIRDNFCKPRKIDNMPNYYCKLCGGKYPTVSSLTASYCPRHPEGISKGRHELYQGNEKSKYCCQYCGQQYPSIAAMTASLCLRHPKGPNKGRHAPAL